MAKTHKSLGVRQRGGIQGAQSAPDNATVYIAACAWSLAALQLQQQQQQLLHRCCCGVSEVAATPTPASSLWQRNCVKNYSGILITLVNILPESEKKEFLDSDSDSYETRDATNEVNALQLQQQTQNVASSQIEACGCACISESRNMQTPQTSQVFIHEIAQIGKEKKTGRIRGVRGQLKLIACSGSVHFQQHQGSNALNTRTRPSRWHRMLQQQHQTATTHLLTCSSPPYRHCSSGVLRPGSKLHPQSPLRYPVPNSQYPIHCHSHIHIHILYTFTSRAGGAPAANCFAIMRFFALPLLRCEASGMKLC